METTVHYRSPDPIQNLRIRVNITRVSAPRQIRGPVEQRSPRAAPVGEAAEPPIPSTAGEAPASPQADVSERGGNGAMWQTLTRTFDWQEKVFGGG